MERSNTSFSDQDAFDQLLSFPLPTGNSDLSAQEAFSEIFLNSNFSTDNGNLNYSVSAPSHNTVQSGYDDSMTISPADVSFLSQTALATPLATPSYCTPLIHPHQEEMEEFLTPLVSPAITPNYNHIYQFLDPPNEQYFTPLSSPALLPNQYADENVNYNTAMINNTSPSNVSNVIQNAAILTQQLAQIETKPQMLRDQVITSPAISPTYRKSPLAMFSSRPQQTPLSPLPYNHNNKRRSTTLRQKIALASPQIHSSQEHHIHLPTTPATPASLMNMSHHLSSTATTPLIRSEKIDVDNMPILPPAAVPEAVTPPSTAVKARKLAPSTSPGSIISSPRTLKPLYSPFLQPDLRHSNLIVTRTQTPGIENRRSAHKVAEQRRRDTLKQSFDSLRKEITDVLVIDSDKPQDEKLREEKEKQVKLMSKVLLLQHSYEYIIRLKTDSRLKDEKMSKMQAELDVLRKLAQQTKAEQ